MANPDLDKALSSLPHGPEFRFLDHILELEPGRRGAAEYRVRGNEPFLAGHFPGAPIFPGVLLIEAAAQLAGVVAQSDPAQPVIPGLKLTAIRAAKLLGTARPGQTLRLTAELLARMDRLVQARVEGFVNDQRVLQAEVTLGS